MAGKHSQKSSNAPLVILIIVAVIVITAIVAGVIFLMNGGMSLFTGEDPQSTTAAETMVAATAVPTSALPETTAAAGETTAPLPTEQETGVAPDHQEQVDVVVPTEEGVETHFFNATFIPNGEVEDTLTDSRATLREVFGQSYADGVLTFNSDGTFTDTLIASESNRGAYVVQGENIHATYTNDRNMRIEVSEWDGDTPKAFTILYGDYLVHFG